MTKAECHKFLEENWKLSTLHFKWGRDVVRLLNKRGEQVAKASGGGYDMRGSALGEMINQHFGEQLLKLDAHKFAGVSHFNQKTRKYQRRPSKNTKTYVNGGTGFESMRNILNAIGFEVSYVGEDKKNDWYILKVK